MSVAVCRGPVLPTFQAPSWPRHAEPYKQPEVVVEHRPAQADVWNAIHADDENKEAAKKQAPSKPYVHPLVRRSMSQKSLEVCTESLGNETGSGDFTSSLDDMASLFGSAPAAAAEEPFWFWQQRDAAACDPEQEAEAEQWETGKDLPAVNYHRSSSRTAARRAFPPPLPSMSRRDGPCLQMRPRRQDGRLVVEAVAVRPRGYLHARRQGGRLHLSFVECFARDQSAGAGSKIAEMAAEAPYFPAVEPRTTNMQEEEPAAVEEVEEDDEVVDDEEEEEKVEVVDRGTVVEVKVSTQTQTAAAAAKVHRSTLVINKFVGGTPLSVVARPRCCHESEAESSDDETVAAYSPRSTLRRVPSSTTSLAAAVAVASTETDVPQAPEDDEESGWVHGSAAAAAETKKQQLLLFTSRRGDKQDLLQSVRRCRQLREKPLFILEPYCIATS
ncbi:unnamed protein product [Urochloa humidicola]